MVHSYCVDGTNLVRGAFGYGGPDFRRQEDADAERLVAALGILCDSLEGRLEVEVFFDGAFRELRSGSRYLRVRFARDVQADDLILDRVRGSQYAGSGRVTVVTGDGELGRMASDEGARWHRVSAGTSLESVLSAIEKRVS
jgi:hypothetical protein